MACIDFSNRKFDCNTLSTILEQDQCKTLNISSNHLDHNALGKLQSALKRTRALVRLNLSHNDFGDGSAKILSDILEENRSLTWINFDYNQVEEEGLQALMKSANGHPTLRKLRLYHQRNPRIFALFHRAKEPSVAGSASILRSDEDQKNINLSLQIADKANAKAIANKDIIAAYDLLQALPIYFHRFFEDDKTVSFDLIFQIIRPILDMDMSDLSAEKAALFLHVTRFYFTLMQPLVSKKCLLEKSIVDAWILKLEKLLNLKKDETLLSFEITLLIEALKCFPTDQTLLAPFVEALGAIKELNASKIATSLTGLAKQLNKPWYCNILLMAQLSFASMLRSEEKGALAMMRDACLQHKDIPFVQAAYVESLCEIIKWTKSHQIRIDAFNNLFAYLQEIDFLKRAPDRLVLFKSAERLCELQYCREIGDKAAAFVNELCKSTLQDDFTQTVAVWRELPSMRYWQERPLLASAAAASSTTASHKSYEPNFNDSHYVPRLDLEESLISHFKTSKAPILVYGVAGSGKTTFVKAMMQKSSDFQQIWFDASNFSSLEAQYFSIWCAKNQAQSHLTQQECIPLLKEEFEKQEKLILIYDHVPELGRDQLEKFWSYLPQGCCRIILTSRSSAIPSRNWTESPQPLHSKAMTVVEASFLIFKILADKAPLVTWPITFPKNLNETKELLNSREGLNASQHQFLYHLKCLIKELGALPQALIEAASTIAKTPTMTIEKFLEEWRQSPSPSDFSLKQVMSILSPTAQRLITYIAYLDPQDIPIAFLEYCLTGSEINNALRDLQEFSLLSITNADRTVSIDPLKQKVIIDLNIKQAQEHLDHILAKYMEMMQASNRPDVSLFIIPHLRSLVKHFDTLDPVANQEKKEWLEGRIAWLESKNMRELLEAAERGNYERVQQLLEKGTTTDPINPFGNTPLFLAATRGDVKMMRLFLENKANMEACDTFYECTPLIQAARGGHIEAVKLLLTWEKPKVNVDAETEGGSTALMLAALGGHEGVVLLLLENGAAINHQNNQGHTALTAAIKGQGAALVPLLLKHGANRYLATHTGETALSMAREKNDQNLMELLEKS